MHTGSATQVSFVQQNQFVFKIGHSDDTDGLTICFLQSIVQEKEKEKNRLKRTKPENNIEKATKIL